MKGDVMGERYDLAIIGSGPGGYVGAIRAAQLGMKVAMVERDRLGGVCLNWGCIPTKALLHTAHVCDEFSHAPDLGIDVGELKIDFAKVQKRKSGIVTRLSKGIQYLMKKRKIEVLTGTGRIIDKKGFFLVLIADEIKALSCSIPWRGQFAVSGIRLLGPLMPAP